MQLRALTMSFLRPRSRPFALRAAAALFCIAASFSLAAQEALKSAEEEYFDFLSIQGKAKRGFLSYRTLSDSIWTLATDEETGEEVEHVWAENILVSRWTLWQAENPFDNWFARGINQDIRLKVYGPELFNSVNTAAPYGQNDGGLWQGKGYNMSFTAGARIEAYGFEVTLKPQVSFSQNMAFEYMTPRYSGSSYEGKATDYGYYGIGYIDAPQRFGDSSFWNFDWGDTEVRWSWHSFTVGFGTQPIWLGPAKLNPIIHSNNAASYPKLDIGIRRQRIVIPKVGWYWGDIELRAWWGMLTESDWFDNDDTNDRSLITGFTLSWALPGIFKGLTLGFNRTQLSHWDDISAYTLFGIMIPEFTGSLAKGYETDQRFSFTIDYLIPVVGLEVYFEWARNDYSPNLAYIARYPFHTQGWTFGATKTFNLPKDLKLQLLLELTSLAASDDYVADLISWDTTFYSHHQITQGYTNRGQWLGAGIGTGGNSQYIGARLYHKKGSVDLFFQRRNPDLDYTMFIDSENSSAAEENIRAELSFGAATTYFVAKALQVSAGYVFVWELNYLNDIDAGDRYGNHIELKLKYSF